MFLFWELRGRSLNFHIHVSVSDVHIYCQDRSTGFLEQNRQIQSWEYINVEIGTVAVQFLFWEYFCFQFSVLVLFSALITVGES